MVCNQKTYGGEVKNSPKKFRFIILALALVLGLSAGVYFLFSSVKSDETEIMDNAKIRDEAEIRDVFDRFQAAMKDGDINGMTACAPSDRYDNNFLLVFDLTTDFRDFTQNGRYHVSGIDFTDDSTMIRSFVQAVGLEYSIRSEDSIEFGVDEGGEWATLNVIQTIVVDGETARCPAFYTMIKQQNRWYIGYAQFIGTEEVRCGRLVDRFITAIKAGDIEDMRTCCIEDSLEDGLIPLFGDADLFRAELEEGGLDIDFTSDSTMLRGFVEAINLDFTPITFQGFYLSEDGQSAEQDVIQSYMDMESGEMVQDTTYFKLLRHDGRWYIDFETEETES